MRKEPNVVPVFDWPSAGEAASSPSRHARTARPPPPARIPPRPLLDDRELADIVSDSRTVDLEDVESRRHVEVVARAQVPGHVAQVRSVLPQGLHQIAVH